jgi:Cu/Ag efflux protein CusF
MVKAVKAGDAVQFVVELEKGAMVITELKKRP